MLTAYANAGRCDWDTFARVLDHLAREGIELLQYGRAPLAPQLQERAFAASPPRPDGPLAAVAGARRSSSR